MLNAVRYMTKQALLKTAICLVCLTLCACNDSPSISISDKSDIGIPDALLEIHAPINGSTLPANQPVVLDYEVIRGDKGSYIRLKVDKQKSVKIARTKGMHRIDPLPPGKHTITLTEYTAEGRKTGGHATISIVIE